MAAPRTILRTAGGELTVGEIPRVVGTVSSTEGPVPARPRDFPCDIIEMRHDELPQKAGWLERSRQFEAIGLPVILTIRHSSEGGKWRGAEEARYKILQEAWEWLAAVDVEFRAAIARPAATAARAAGKAAIVSYHDFDRTPPPPVLRSIIAEAQQFASIVKITTMIQGDEDIGALKELLRGGWDVPLSVFGMGPRGAETRVAFAVAGSCLNYGYLDKPMAPGQLSAGEMSRSLAERLPVYREDFERRKRAAP